MSERTLYYWAREYVDGIKTEGRLEGIVEGRLEDARLMKADGVPFEQIARWTNIPLEIIKTL